MLRLVIVLLMFGATGARRQLECRDSEAGEALARLLFLFRLDLVRRGAKHQLVRAHGAVHLIKRQAQPL